MREQKDQSWNEISTALINNARVELAAEKIIKREGLRNKHTGELTKKTYDFFRTNYSNDLAVYQQKKKIGYNLIVLYKGVAMVGSAYFGTPEGKEMEALPLAEDWPVYQLAELKRKILTNLFNDPWDNRTDHCYKPSVEKFWELLEKIFLIDGNHEA
jgi:hypothetical protein